MFICGLIWERKKEKINFLFDLGKEKFGQSLVLFFALVCYDNTCWYGPWIGLDAGFLYTPQTADELHAKDCKLRVS